MSYIIIILAQVFFRKLYFKDKKVFDRAPAEVLAKDIFYRRAVCAAVFHKLFECDRFRYVLFHIINQEVKRCVTAVNTPHRPLAARGVVAQKEYEKFAQKQFYELFRRNGGIAAAFEVGCVRVVQRCFECVCIFGHDF